MTASPAILLARLAARADVAGPDADLLARFRHARDEAAFAELVRRHGPAVYRVCRRLVGPAAADDAFQATFLVLATRAGTVKTPGAVGGWLVGVAGRVARQMRAARLRRHRHEAAFAADPFRPTSDTPASLELAEQFRILDEELTRLPDRVRGPVVLCLLEGRTHDQAAADLGGSPRTVRRRLDEAKRLLRLRLERRGVVPAVAAALAAGAGEAATAVPVGLGSRTVAAVFDFLAGGTATAAAPAAIAKGVVAAMIARKLAMVLTAAAVGLTALGVGVGGAGDGPGPAKPADAAKETVDVTKPAPPVKAAAEPAGPVEHLTPNFAVKAPTREAATEIGAAAERLRKELAEAWLGKELPPWKERCHVMTSVSSGLGSFSANVQFAKDAPAIKSMTIAITSRSTKLVIDQLPQGVLECLVAADLGRRPPNWVKSGLFHLANDPKASQQNWIARGMLDQDKLTPLREVLEVTYYHTANTPRAAMFPVSGSVSWFLIERKSRPELLRFVRVGMEDGGWDQAAYEVYGFRSVEELERAWLARLGQLPARPVPLEPEHYQTDNFAVTAPSRQIARRIAEEAERHRKEKAIEWLGAELPVWYRSCPIEVSVSPWNKSGATTFTFGKDEDGKPVVSSHEMKLSGTVESILANTLPHEVMHTVLAHHFGRPIPRWADEGICLLAESADEQKAHDIRCREILNTGRAIPLRHLFPMKEYPNDMPVLFAQGHSVCRFLLNREVPAWNLFVAEDGTTSQFAPAWPLLEKAFNNHRPDPPTRRLLQFVRVGMLRGWDAAAKDVYGFASVDELQEAWVASFQPPPAEGKQEPIPPPGPRGSGVTTVAPTQTLNRAIGGEVLYQWRTAGKRWFGGDLHYEARPGMGVIYQPAGNFHWSADVKYAAGKASVLDFTVAGPLDRVLEREVPFVVTYALLADHLGEGVPAWAVHGLGQLAQTERHQAELDHDCRELLRKGKAVRLSALLAGGPTLFTETNNGTQSQEHSVCRFLLTLKPEADLIRFVKSGMIVPDWNVAAKRVYDVADADALEAAWLKWMTTPASRLAAPAAVPPPPAPAGPPRIPPTPVSDAAEPDRVGRIVIKGNTATADRVIVDLLKLYPGQVLEYPKLDEAKTNLVRSGLFDAADRPTVTVVPRTDGSHFQDIEVRVKEAKTGAFLLDATVNSNAGTKK